MKWKDEAEAGGVGIQVYLDLDENVPLVKDTVTGLYNIILNPLFNAVDALPDGGDITVITRQTEDGAFISVRDNGVGMDETVQKRIFEPFFSNKMKSQTCFKNVEKRLAWSGGWSERPSDPMIRK